MTEFTPRQKHLLSLHHGATKKQSEGKPAEALPLWLELIALQPDWEHGLGYYDLAGCQEDVGLLEDARISYEKAITYEPQNDMYWGGLASFHYLHGDPQKSLEAYLKILELKRGSMSPQETMPALKELAARLKMPRDKLDEAIAKAVSP